MVKITTTQFITGELQPVDRLGNPTRVEAGTEQFTSSDESVFVVERDPNFSASFKVIPKGEGVARLDFSADADRGDGVRTISGFLGIEVQAADAVGFGLKLSDPTELPELPTDADATGTGENPEEPQA